MGDLNLDSFLAAQDGPKAPPPLNLDSFLAAQAQPRPQRASDALPQPDQADAVTTHVGRALAEAATRPAPPAQAPSFWDNAKSVLQGAARIATTHSVKALGGATATELWDNAGQSAKSIFEHLTAEPWQQTREQLPAPAKTAEFLFHASKLIPGILDFFYTPLGAATAGTAGLPAGVQAGAGAAFGTQMAEGVPPAYKRFKAAPSPATAGDLVGATAGALLPVFHAAGTEYRNQVRDALTERAKAPEQQYTSTGEAIRPEGLNLETFLEEENAHAKTEHAGEVPAPEERPAAAPAGQQAAAEPGLATPGAEPGGGQPGPAAGEPAAPAPAAGAAPPPVEAARPPQPSAPEIVQRAYERAKQQPNDHELMLEGQD